MKSKLGLALLTAVALLLSIGSPAHAATREFRYVANDDEAHIVSSFENVPGIAPRGIMTVEPTGSSITIHVDDAATLTGETIAIELYTNRTYSDLCVADGETRTLSGLTAGTPLRITIGGTPGPYSIHAHCTGVATTGVATFTGVS
ncbi:MAG: hypothetical protein QOG03_858 [Actinomycetota bacterium]|jgi:hypothetical protein|nr:hypothetical protein [Actinomycetota bacterium]